jgi:hypothetical protein
VLFCFLAGLRGANLVTQIVRSAGKARKVTMPDEMLDTEIDQEDSLDDSDQEEVEEVSETSTDEPEGAKEEESGEEQVQYTEKGTKLDPKPESAAYQQLANERRVRQQYEQVLRNPDLLKRYMQESGFSEAEIKQEQKKRFSTEQIKDANDLVNVLNQITDDFDSKSKAYEQEIQNLKSNLTGMGRQREMESVTNKLQTEINQTAEKYPELNPKSSSYDPELEKAVASLYHEIDFDQQAGFYRGGHSILSVADKIMTAAKKAKARGSEEAQTSVRQKVAGKVVTSKKATGKSESQSEDPGTEIARRISKALGK